MDRGIAPSTARRASNMLALVGLAGLVGLMYYLDSIYEIYWHGHAALFVWHSMVAASVALLVTGIALGGGLTRALFENRLAVFLGTISYSIYLWHYPLGIWIMRAIDMNGMTIARFLAITVPVIVAVSALSYYAVERPFLRKAKA
jgi:peptidoglycan/LPS O-acetylase OafA/YrhL